MLNFNELPADIKELIFKNNRPATSREINNNKEKYNNVLDHIESIIELTCTDYYDDTEEDNIIDNDWGFGNAMLECITNENIENMLENQMEKAWDLYYNNYD